MIGRKVFKRLVKGYKLKSEGKVEDDSVKHALVAPGTKVVVKYMPTEPPTKVTESEKEESEADVEGIEIPVFKSRSVRIVGMKPEQQRLADIKYPLIPSEPKKGEPIYAYAHISWDQKLHKYVYNVIEPGLSPKLKVILNRIKDLMEQRLDIDFSKLRKFDAIEYLKKNTDEMMEYFDFRINEAEKQILRYYIKREFIGLGKIEPLMKDPNIEDISCDGVNISLFIFHRNSKIGSVTTNVAYRDSDELDSFITRLVQLCGKSISMSEPLVDGSLPDGSRLQATLATDIARRGSNFTIRRFTKIPLTPIHLIDYNTLDIRTMAYLWTIVDYGFSILVSGGTASGKTTLLNVLSLFIKPDKKIISIEDTAELQLPHPHWIPSVARTSIAERGMRKKGDVDLFDLLKESFRQRPDYIVVGEVRGREAYVLFQQMATGHPSFATIHAENMQKLMDRLTTPPIDLPAGLIDSLDIVVFLARMRYKDNYVRRVTEIVEILKYDTEKGEPRTNTVFKWNAMTDKFECLKKSFVLKKLSQRTGIPEKDVIEEMERRMALLSWMKENNVTNYRDVNRVTNMYYNYPQRTMSMIMSQM